MDNETIRWVLGFLLMGPIGWLWRKLMGVEKEMAALNKAQADHRLHVSENYMKAADVKSWMADSKADMSRTLDDLKSMLSRIEDKLDRKVDK